LLKRNKFETFEFDIFVDCEKINLKLEMNSTCQIGGVKFFQIFYALQLLPLFGFVLYIAYKQIPNLSPSKVLENKKLDEWKKYGRFLNHNGFAIFYKDSLGDAINKNISKKESLKVIEEILSKPIYLLLHGFPSFSIDFEPIYPHLIQKYHVVAFDFLGCGLSDKPFDVEYSFAMQANVVDRVVSTVLEERKLFRTLLKHEKVENEQVDIHVLSHDIGVSVAQELLARQFSELDETVVENYEIEDEDAIEKNKIKNRDYEISSMIFLNGGLFAETHFPTIGFFLLLLFLLLI
jgi:hypothetical protein